MTVIPLLKDQEMPIAFLVTLCDTVLTEKALAPLESDLLQVIFAPLTPQAPTRLLSSLSQTCLSSCDPASVLMTVSEDVHLFLGEILP